MKSISVALLLAVLVASPALAGVVFQIEMKDHDESPPRTDSVDVAVEGGSVKMGIAGGGEDSKGTMVFRGERSEMMIVSDKDKSYFIMDRQAVKEMAVRMQQISSQMEEMLKNVPESQRPMMEKMMKQRMPQQAPPKLPPTKIKMTGERETLHGYPCVKYDILSEGRKIRELWVTDWDNIKGSGDVVTAFEAMAAFYKELLESFASFAGAEESDQFGKSIFEHMEELDGFPVVTKNFDNAGSLESESFLRSAKAQRIDPAEFEPPAGYKQQKMLAP